MTGRDVLDRLGRGWSDLWTAVRQELSSNPRARLGIVAVGLVLLVAGGLRLWNHTVGRQAQIVTLSVQERELAALVSPEQASRWTDADTAFAQRLAEARARLWSNAPMGVAHADFYAWTQQAAISAGLSGAQVRLGDVRRVGGASRLVEMRVSVLISSAQGGGVSQAGFHDFLKRIALEPRFVVARSLRLRFVEPMALEADLATFWLPQTAGAGVGDASAAIPERQVAAGGS